MSMKRLLLTTTAVLALGLGGTAFAQSGAGSSAGAGAMGSANGSPSYSAPNTGDQGMSGSGGSSINDSETNGSGANGGPMADNSASQTSARRGMTMGRVSTAQVKQAQEALQTQGLYRGQVDGKFGPQTRHAVAQFQKQKGLKQTAQLDEQTMNDLQNGSMSGSDNMSSSPNGHSVPSNVTGQGTPGNGPADSSTNPGGMNGGDTMPTH